MYPGGTGKVCGQGGVNKGRAGRRGERKAARRWPASVISAAHALP